jgi:tRNA(Ile)-lysidine synthase
MTCEPKKLIDRVGHCLEGYGLAPDQTIFCGFSGGADSTALILLVQLAGRRQTAVHLNHELRGEQAKEDAAWCHQFCHSRGIDFECHDLDVTGTKRPGESLEEAARRCRLNFWKEYLGRGAVVALGHHADDAVEDLLLRLARGSNTSGLTGLREDRTFYGIRFLRPLLGLRRKALIEFLKEQGVQDWREDQSNDDTRFRRNAVRKQWLPLIRNTLGSDKALHRSLAALRADAEYLEGAAVEALPAHATVEAFRKIHVSLLPRVLRLWIERETGCLWLPRYSAVERVVREIEQSSEHPRQVPLGDNVTLVINKGVLRVASAFKDYDLTWRWRDTPLLRIPQIGLQLETRMEPAGPLDRFDRENRDVAIFPETALPDELNVRNWRNGDRFTPFGHSTLRKVKDTFSAAAIPADRRPLFPLVRDGHEILWIAGIKRSRSRPAKPADSVVIFTRRAIEGAEQESMLRQTSEILGVEQ